MRRIILLVTVALVMAAMMALAGPASAITIHQHQIVTQQSEAADPLVAGGICKNQNETAFKNFHGNVHVDAPGLDDNEQVEIKKTTDC